MLEQSIPSDGVALRCYFQIGHAVVEDEQSSVDSVMPSYAQNRKNKM